MALPAGQNSRSRASKFGPSAGNISHAGGHPTAILCRQQREARSAGVGQVHVLSGQTCRAPYWDQKDVCRSGTAERALLFFFSRMCPPCPCSACSSSLSPRSRRASSLPPKPAPHTGRPAGPAGDSEGRPACAGGPAGRSRATSNLARGQRRTAPARGTDGGKPVISATDSLAGKGRAGVRAGRCQGMQRSLSPPPPIPRTWP